MLGRHGRPVLSRPHYHQICQIPPDPKLLLLLEEIHFYSKREHIFAAFFFFFFLTSCCVTVDLTGRKGPVSCRYTYFHTFTWSSAAIPRYALNVGASPPSRIAYTNTDKGLFVSSGKPAVILISSFQVFILKKMTSAISCVLRSPQVLAGGGR